MRGLRVALLTVLAALALPAGASAEVTVTKDEANQRVIVEINESPLDEILQQIGTSYGFTIQRSGPGTEGIPVSGRYEGPLDTVLSRLLRSEGHMIERSKEAAAGIVRIVLFGSPQSGNGTMVAQRQGRHRPTQAHTDEDEAAALAEAEAAEAEQQAALEEEHRQQMQAQQMRKNRVAPNGRPRTARDGM